MPGASNLHSLESDVPFDTIITILSSSRTFQYGFVAALTVVVYDTIVTIDQEMKSSPITHFNPVTLAFALIRCCGIFRSAISSLVNDLHNSVITPPRKLGGQYNWLILKCIDYVLCIRIRAFYSLSSKDKKIAKFIQILFYVEAAITLGIVLHSIITTRIGYLDLSGLKPCAILTAPSLWINDLSWGVLLLYQVITMALLLSKTISLQRSLGNRGVRLTKLVLHDQLTYIIIVVICGIAHLVELKLANSPQDVPLIVQVILDLLGSASMLSIVGAWMILHLKRAGEEIPREGSLNIPTHPSTNTLSAANTERDDGRQIAAHGQA